MLFITCDEARKEVITEWRPMTLTFTRFPSTKAKRLAPGGGLSKDTNKCSCRAVEEI